MKRTIRNTVVAIVVLVAVAAALFMQRDRLVDLVREGSSPALPPSVEYKDTTGAASSAVTTTVTIDETKPAPAPASGTKVPVNPVPTTPPPNPPPPSEPSVPLSFNLAVPFTSQAPYSVWDEVHEETCEEAAVYMVAAFYKGVVGTIDLATAEAELQRLVAIENDTFGYYKDTTAAETARLAKIAYGFSRVDLIDDPTADQIKALIAAGHPVVVPTAGRDLHNPNFTGDGPPYHMITLRGYTATQFVSNDPGTRRGEAYVYGIDTVMSAMHDWNGGDVEHGAKVVIVIYP